MPPKQDTRKGDRHKEKKDRHRPGYIRPDRRDPDNPELKRPKGRPKSATPKPARPGWNGRFVAVDGEGWNGRYNLLACSALNYDLYAEDGLTTKACLRYLTGWGIRGGDALVGFGLSYDFENMLRDVPDEDYRKLMNSEEIEYLNFKLKYIPRKFIQIQVDLGKVDENGKPRKKTVFLQDVLGFFQTSFAKALEKWNIETPPIIEEGKALRGDFKDAPLDFIKRYNREELRLLVELMEKLREADREAFQAIGLKPNHTPRTWYGPGARASNFLRQTDWIGEHPQFTGPIFEELQKEMAGYIAQEIRYSPPPEYFEIEKEIKEAKAYLDSIPKSLAASLRETDEAADLFKKIKDLGGIAASPTGALAAEYEESIPRTLKRKKGRPLDEIADELGLTARGLLDGIRDHRAPRSREEIMREALKIAETLPETIATETTLKRLEAIKAEMAPEVSPASVKRLADLMEHPFAAAFFGGRIEAAAIGEFLERLFDYDINSAYPFAISNLPAWNPDDLRKVDGFDHLARMGMYLVEWNCPPGANLYPFPYRSQTGNVFYPPQGRGWYMSPEVHAAREVWGDRIHVIKGYVLDRTEGFGDGVTPLPDHLKCTTALKVDLMAKIRLEAKKKGLSMEKALKLVLNSCYGKTIQQIGSHKFLNSFAASWITSTCRAIISRTVGQDTENKIISIMTDGILSRVPLKVDVGVNLGQFEATEFDHAIQFMPGVYYLKNSETGKKESKYRGMDKNFDPEIAKKILWEEYREEKYKNENGEIKIKKFGAWPVKINMFVTRNLALHQPNKFDPLRFQFVPVEKEEEFSLKSKRFPGKKGFRLLKKEQNKFFSPKTANPLELRFFGSKPYELDLPDGNQYDEADDMEELLAETRLATLLESDHYDLI